VAERRRTIFLLLGMLAWVAAAIGGTLLVWGAVALGAFGLRRLGSNAVPQPTPLVFTLAGGFGFHGTLLLGALWQGRRLGNSGLGIGPIRRVGLIALLCALTIFWLAGLIALTAAIPALHDFMKSMTPEFFLAEIADAGALVTTLLLTLVVILAPVAEELFFRGWLWEALRRRGQTVPITACLTAIPWLLLHGIESPWRILFLIPAAVIFAFARQLGGGVLASLTVHVTNNLAIVLVQVLASEFGDG